MPVRNLVAWNSMIVGYAQHGFGMEAVELFDRMETEDTQPNDITFIGILSACMHGGLAELRYRSFEVMKTRGVMPRVEHYACMVDLLARAGQTKRAYELIKSMPMDPNVIFWRSLLARCKTHDDLEVGQLVVHQLRMADPGDASARAMESFLNANVGLWIYKDKFRCKQKKATKKVPGRSYVSFLSKRYHEY
ncbi:hypothetical protein HPP92_000056 [Vanilla planifolia]|uniref:Pentatricopeptide repeat-containing protein n=1 Tax=Vanilla planifolia TaxID=51239 RepID=A0A835RXB5_VANPL|nr:hypothetical protein HPP92_000056 [Vanilla planifolia]